MNAEEWRHAKGVLAEALLIPPAERDALIAARCPDPAMRREVQDYLNQYDERFLETVITVSDTIDSTAALNEAGALPDIHDGDHIGPYVVVGRLGAGGMGHVFLGNDARLQRKVALKCLSATASATELRSRILHEARAAARITHPNIAIVHDVVEHDSRPFLVMEYVEGENLAVLIKRERPSIGTIVRFLRQLASALAAAHAKGIVHRDLKPANIQVTPDGSVKILDFGVAHAMSAAGADSPRLAAADLTVPMGTLGTLGTMTGGTPQADRRVMHPGTPAYMSPEQMFGRAIDQRSDIYSLGVIVYEMATGHRPYSTDDPLEVVLTLSRNFLRPGDAETALPVQLNDVISRMLAVKPEDRYQTAGELENALVTLTAPTAVPVPLTPARARLRVAGRVALAVAAAAASVALLGFIETAAFNSTLGRTAPFDRESPAIAIEMGFRGLVVPAVWSVVFFIAYATLRFVIRVMSLSPGVEHLLTTSVMRTTRFSERLGLDDPSVMSQAVAGVGVLLMALLFWRYWTFIAAWAGASINRLPAEWYAPLKPGKGQGRLDAQTYRIAFSAAIVLFTVAIARIVRLRARSAVPSSPAGLMAVCAMLLLVILMCQAPFRIVWHNELPLLNVAGERCFALGQSGDDLLIHCPDRTPPRNRVVKRTNPAIRNTGVFQNIFAPPEDVSTNGR